MTDALGTVREIVDANKVAQMTYKYDIFGAIRQAVGTDPFGIPQTFTGKELDTDSGLHYFGARYYDSSLGRFITADSWTWGPDDERAVFAAQSVFALLGTEVAGTTMLNPYIYCLNNPLGMVDPSGHLVLLIILILLAVIFVALLMANWSKVRKLRGRDITTWYLEWVNSLFPNPWAAAVKPAGLWAAGEVLNRGQNWYNIAVDALPDAGDTMPVGDADRPIYGYKNGLPRDLSSCPPGSE